MNFKKFPLNVSNVFGGFIENMLLENYNRMVTSKQTYSIYSNVILNKYTSGCCDTHPGYVCSFIMVSDLYDVDGTLRRIQTRETPAT